ncbi:MAG: CerR family C-terminal domain-containing protein [Chthoniobacterales bacterium]
MKKQNEMEAEQRLIQAAGEVFGEKGYKAATAREITHRAETNLAAINYYFRGKKGLYSAALRHAVSQLLRQNEDIDEAAPPEEQLYAIVHERLVHFLDPSIPRWYGQILAREIASPSQSLNIVTKDLFLPRIHLMKRIVSQLSGKRPGERQLSLISLSIISQCSYYRQAAPLIERLFPKLHPSKNIAEIARHITDFSLAGLRASLN